MDIRRAALRGTTPPALTHFCAGHDYAILGASPPNVMGDPCACDMADSGKTIV